MNNEFNQNPNFVNNEVPNTEPMTVPVPPVLEQVPVTTPVLEEVSIPVVDPVNVSASEPVTVPVVENNTIPVVDPMNVPASEPVTVPVAENNTIPVVDPMNVPVSEPNTTPVAVMPEPVTIPVSAPTDQNVVVNNNLKKVEIKEYTPPSKAKVVLLIIFFILLVAFIIFLPDITVMIDNYKSGGVNYNKEEIVTGRLECFLNSNTSNLDKNYEITFRYTDKKLTSFKLMTTTKGDISADKEELSSLSAKCKDLEKESETLDGITVRCDTYDDRVIETQSLSLESVDYDKLDAAYTEAGGINPGYRYNQDIDLIEKNMNASGYTCSREK